VEPERLPIRSGVPTGGVVAASALLCCFVIHVAAAKAHAGVRGEASLFVVAALAQLLLGLVALFRWTRLVRMLIIASSLVITGGWLLSRTRGLPIFGVETVGMGDAVSSSLQVLAAGWRHRVVNR
jgi:membrane protein YdbS with pleckstrin-like domain